MKINFRKTVIFLTLMALGWLILAACASSEGIEVSDQRPQSRSNEKSIYVGPMLVDCQGEGLQKCMLVKENIEDDYELFYDQIEGFDFEEGYEYRLVVREEQIENPPAGGSSVKWSLVQIENKEPVPIAGDMIEKTIYVGPELVDCTGVAPQKCMLVKENPEEEYTYFYDQIEGFDYLEGYEYKLLVRVEPMSDAPADASLLKWSLVKVESKKPAISLDEAQLEGTDWVLDSLLNEEGKMVEPLSESKITVRFQDGGLNGNAGCNGYFGVYEADGDKIKIGSLASTEMFCMNPPGVMDQETFYLRALENVVSYSIDQEHLILKNEDGITLLVFRVDEPMSFIDNIWEVINYNNGKEAVVSVIIGTKINAVFDDEGRLSGSAGCNNYSASYEIDAERITIGPAIATRMACSEPEGIMEQEMDYLAALEMASTFSLENDRLILLDSNGHQVATFQVGRSFELTETIWHLDAYNNGEGAVVSSLEGVDTTVIFSQEGRILGSAGCNGYTGSYRAEDSEIRVELGPVTLMSCSEPAGVMEQEAAYLNSLQAVANFTIVGKSLRMMDDAGQELLTFSASELVGYDWKWMEFVGNDDSRITPEIPANYTLRFRPDMKVDVQADCNQVLGSYNLNDSQVEIELGLTTLAACPPDSLSEKYLQLLSDAVIYFREGDFLYLDIKMDAGTMKFVE